MREGRLRGFGHRDWRRKDFEVSSCSEGGTEDRPKVRMSCPSVAGAGFQTRDEPEEERGGPLE